jgi:hypothetical protein
MHKRNTIVKIQKQKEEEKEEKQQPKREPISLLW